MSADATRELFIEAVPYRMPPRPRHAVRRPYHSASRAQKRESHHRSTTPRTVPARNVIGRSAAPTHTRKALGYPGPYDAYCEGTANQASTEHPSFAADFRAAIHRPLAPP